ncbi:sulfurtransferase [Luteimonas vadosa]|uniref:Sulfurtransferase n=1 Tax=Luteimonas vadosa TaxID=1165507 RepID=A0ABP9E707_9GAMM
MLSHIAAYRFTPIHPPDALAASVHAWAGDLGLKGSVVVAAEGINLFLAGEYESVAAFVRELRGDPRLAAIEIRETRCRSQPFGRLKVKVKPEIITFRRPDASPLASRAPAVAPATLARWIGKGCDDEGRRLVLLDTRNREEVAHGTFGGALRLPIDNFTELPEALAPHRDALSDATVVGFCTGGIRCEKAARWMQASGMDHVLQLDGGILGYFQAVGGYGYDGACFVFDGRVAVDPELRPVGAPEAGQARAAA